MEMYINTTYRNTVYIYTIHIYKYYILFPQTVGDSASTGHFSG